MAFFYDQILTKLQSRHVYPSNFRRPLLGVREVWLVIIVIRHIKVFSKFGIVLLKKEFTSSAISLSFCGNSFSSTSFYVLSKVFFSWEKKFHSLPKNLSIFLQKRDLSCWKSFSSYFFYKGYCNSSYFVSYKLLRNDLFVFQ